MIYDRIKVVFWDLDDTLWRGILAEGEDVRLCEDIVDIVKTLNKRGIVNSVCSNNDHRKAEQKLQELGIRDLFVFPQISFRPKGEMIGKALAEMNLRPVNALFIDDNDSNLKEAEYYNPGISTLNCSECRCLLDDEHLAGKKDEFLSRLKQYKQLENKTEARSSFTSNEDFLRQSNIKIGFLDIDDSLMDRLHELTERTNQLNFTKNRMSAEELHQLVLRDDVEMKMIHVTDNFCDYGLAGFYALEGDRLIHFVFSCRIMNMHIEQFVYSYLGCPKLETVGEVAATVSEEAGAPDYISVQNRREAFDSDSIDNILDERSRLKIYAVGACDLYYSIGFFSMPNQDLIYECNVHKGDERSVNVGTEYLRSVLEMNEAEKQYCREHFRCYTGSLAFETALFREKHDYVIMSFHDDEIMKVYEKKDDDNLRVLLSPSASIIPVGRTSIINIGIEDPSYEQQQEWLKERFEPGYYLSPERVKENIRFIAGHVDPETKFILITGPELEFFSVYREQYPDARKRIISINKVLFELEEEDPERFAVADINKVIKTRDDVWDYIYHFPAKTAYDLFVEISRTIIGKLGNSKPSMLHNAVSGKRKVMVVGDGPEAEYAFYNLKLGNADPEGIMSAGDYQTSGKEGRPYYVVADKDNYPEIRRMLISDGLEPVKDFVHLEPVEYEIEWNEEKDFAFDLEALLSEEGIK